MPKPDDEPLRRQHVEAGDEADEPVDSELLEAVLLETMTDSNRESLELIFGVARDSQYADTANIHAVEEVVQAILAKRFRRLHFSRRLLNRIAQSLIEDPEATVKLERLWQEARASG